jgi:hypothetical protein
MRLDDHVQTMICPSIKLTGEIKMMLDKLQSAL